MSFQDNSGDLIIDLVLTDEGRARMARGDGSFKIAKWSASDDGIDYGLYNKNHPSGSAYFDLNILQTPVLEAIANNASSMKYKLLSLQRSNLQYLPIIKLNRQDSATDFHSTNTFIVAVDKNTEDSVALTTSGHTTGVMFGQRLDPAGYILCEQGLDTTEYAGTLPLDPELVETQYTVEIDNRLGKLVSVKDKAIAKPSYIDEDNMASYRFTLGTTPNFVVSEWPGKTTDNTNAQVIRGPRGTRLSFMIASSIELATNSFLFDQLGGTNTIESVSCKTIDSIVRIEGGTTGFSLSVPVRFAKKI